MTNKELKRKIFLEAAKQIKEQESEKARQIAKATRDYDNGLITWEEFNKIREVR